jgi:hypothetical protein
MPWVQLTDSCDKCFALTGFFSRRHSAPPEVSELQLEPPRDATLGIRLDPEFTKKLGHEPVRQKGALRGLPGRPLLQSVHVTL